MFLDKRIAWQHERIFLPAAWKEDKAPMHITYPLITVIM